MYSFCGVDVAVMGGGRGTWKKKFVGFDERLDVDYRPRRRS